jgi:hypothetical protein
MKEIPVQEIESFRLANTDLDAPAAFEVFARWG